MHIQVYLKVVGALVEMMLWFGEERFVIVLLKQSLLLQSTLVKVLEVWVSSCPDTALATCCRQ